MLAAGAAADRGKPGVNMRLLPNDWEVCSRAVQSVYDCAAAGLLSQGLLPVLAHLVPADAVAHAEINFQQDHFSLRARPDRPVDG